MGIFDRLFVKPEASAKGQIAPADAMGHGVQGQQLNNPHGGEIPVIHINEPGIGEAPQWVMDTTNFFLCSDWTGPHLPYTAGSEGSGIMQQWCNSPRIVGPSYLINTVPVIIEPQPLMSQIPTPMPLTLY